MLISNIANKSLDILSFMVMGHVMTSVQITLVQIWCGCTSCLWYVLQFQPTSTLHQVCNPTTPKSTLGTSTHQNKEPYTFRRSLNFETWCTPWGGASKYKDELKKFFAYFKFQNLLWGSSWGPSPSHGTIWSPYARGIVRRWRQTRTWASTRSKIATLSSSVLKRALCTLSGWNICTNKSVVIPWILLS
jgi:hypothetical protein